MTIKVRVDKLERRSRGVEVIGVTYDGEHITVRESGEVQELTLAEFEQEYPDGVILHVVYENW